ncbi:MAG TPA: PEP-CTERM sorting domain-containing protein [Lacipirellulaceae bacterium]|jgi:hypothetical protein|nr:PEP-CTERM sorting domain-containing protein [Lacipirellulaceae bacterium]
MQRLAYVFAVTLLIGNRAFAGSVITTNLPANTAIINISGTQDGAADYGGTGQDFWYQPFFTGGATALLEYTIQPGTYTFRLTNPTLAAAQFSTLTGGQLGQIYTAWSYNYPWATDYMVFDSAAATDASLPQLFSGAITPPAQLPGFGSADAAFNNAEKEGFANEIFDSPGGRYTGTVKLQRSFATATTLIFVVPDNALGDNTGGISIVIAPATSTGVAGDYNGNGVVDAADYVVWRKGVPLQNEVATIGSITGEDYSAWRARFGKTFGSGASDASVAGGSVPVPEPATLFLIAIGVVAAGAARARGED